MRIVLRVLVLLLRMLGLLWLGSARPPSFRGSANEVRRQTCWQAPIIGEMQYPF